MSFEIHYIESFINIDSFAPYLCAPWYSYANECGLRKHGPCISPQLQMTSLKKGFDQATRFQNHLTLPCPTLYLNIFCCLLFIISGAHGCTIIQTSSLHSYNSWKCHDDVCIIVHPCAPEIINKKAAANIQIKGIQGRVKWF